MDMSLSLILAESALEMIPPSIRAHPSVTSHARRTGKRPSSMLLDNSWHYSAMKGLPHAEKRGRPDLVHLAVVTVTSTPLYQRRGALDLYVHTVDDRVIRFGPGVRIPKSYHRFAGLIEALYLQGSIKAAGLRAPEAGSGARSGEDRALMELVKDQPIGDLIREKGFRRVVGLSTEGTLLDRQDPYRSVAERLADGASSTSSPAAVVVGGFQKGHFSERTARHLDATYSVDPGSLEAHVVIARLLYECEKKPFM